MKIVFVGQSYWCADLARGLNTYTSAQASVLPIDHIKDAFGLADLRRLRSADLLVRVGFRPGARTTRGAAFDRLFSLAAGDTTGRLAYFWLGTDVADTLEQAASGADMRRFTALTSDAVHVAVAYHLRDELATVGVRAEVAWMPARNVNRDMSLPLFPETFTVLSYIPDFRHAFYGGDMLLEAARRLPEFEFRITSGVGDWAKPVPPNLHFLGRVEDMVEEYRASSCLVRMVRHDGLSGMVIEAVSYGRPVLYSARLPHTQFVEFGDVDRLESALRQLAARSASKPATEDIENAAWAAEISDEAECYRTLLRAFTGGVGRDEYAAAGD